MLGTSLEFGGGMRRTICAGNPLLYLVHTHHTGCRSTNIVTSQELTGPVHPDAYGEHDIIMPVFALLIISKAGSLIYHRTFPTSNSANTSQNQSTTGTLGLPGTTTLTTNDYLVLAGTFHGVHAITKSLTPRIPAGPSAAGSRDSTQSGATYTYPDPTVAPSGIESMESSFFRLTVFQTLTGTKFLLFTDPSMPNTDVVIKGVYERYADFVCKNPFWQTEMPIRIESWDRSLVNWLMRR